MVSNELQIKNLNKDINGMLYLLAELKANPETEKSFFTRENVRQSLLKLITGSLNLCIQRQKLYMNPV